jgi:hypothetical protein
MPSQEDYTDQPGKQNGVPLLSAGWERIPYLRMRPGLVLHSKFDRVVLCRDAVKVIRNRMIDSPGET